METEANLTNIEIELILGAMKRGSHSIHDKTVLVIDDDKWIHRVITNYLKNWGFGYVSAYDATEGVAMAIKIRPTIILLDIIMPDVNGDVLLKIFKRIELTSNIPIIILSGNLSADVFGKTYKEGAAGFISKPVKEIILLKKIKEILLPEAIFDMRI